MANTSAKSFREYLDGTSLFKFDSTTGQVIPQTTDLVALWTTVIANIFGIPESQIATRFTDSTPFGRLVEALAIRDQRACAITASYANQVNPNYSTGQALDAIAAFFGVNRNSATQTKIELNLTGTAGTTIPSGSQVKNKRGQIFTTDYTVQIDSNGSAICTASSLDRGKIDFKVGSIDTIVSPIEGWSSVSDSGIVTAGYDLETDNSLRTRLMNSRWSGTGFTKSILSAILRVGGINSAIVVDNGDSALRYLAEDGKWYKYTEGGDGIPTKDVIPTGLEYVPVYGHSILVVVDANEYTFNDVALAIFNTKSAGCGYTPLEGQSHELLVNNGLVQYKVVVNTPNYETFNINVKVRRNNYVGSEDALKEEVKGAIRNWADGAVPNIEGLSIGQSVYPFEIGAAISDVIKSIQVASVSLSGSDKIKDGYLHLFIKDIGKIGNIEVDVI